MVLTLLHKEYRWFPELASVALKLDPSGPRAVGPKGFLVSQLSVLIADGDGVRELPSKHLCRKLYIFIMADIGPVTRPL